MPNNDLVERLSSGLGQSATIGNIFGEPIHVDQKTIIPVAKISYGFGGGYGQGPGKRNRTASLQDDTSAQPEGAGGGGGMYASAKGVFEITPTATRFVPATSFRHVMAGIAIGFLLKGFLSSKKIRGR
jgi:uncharacterized spore protein YtfJ